MRRGGLGPLVSRFFIFDLVPFSSPSFLICPIMDFGDLVPKTWALFKSMLSVKANNGTQSPNWLPIPVGNRLVHEFLSFFSGLTFLRELFFSRFSEV